MMRRGFSIVEGLVALAVITTVAVSVYGGVALSYRATARASEKAQAAFLLEEGYEALLYLRDAGWASYIREQPLDSPLSLCVSGGSITLGGTCNMPDANGFTRKVTFKNACRAKIAGSYAKDDILGHTISTMGDCTVNTPDDGTVDAGTKYVLIEVSWGTNNSEQVEVYISSIFSQ